MSNDRNHDLLNKLAEDGYCVVPKLFSRAEVRQISQAFDALQLTATKLTDAGMHQGSQFVIEPGPERTQIHRVVWCGACQPALLTLGAKARLLELASQVLGTPEMDQLINQAHFKLPGDLVHFPWHQDSAHRRHGTELWQDVNGRGSFVQMLTAVDDIDANNGPVYFIPGSHKAGPRAWDKKDRRLLPGDWNADEAIPVMAEAGDTIIFGPYVIHGSPPNTSQRRRRVFINGFAAPGANHRVYPGAGAGRRLSLKPGPADKPARR